METLEARVANQIRRARQRLGLTQSELAHIAKITGAPWTQSKIAAMETGRRDIGLGEALILGNLLGIGLHELVAAADAEAELLVGGVRVTSEQLTRMINGFPVLSGGANTVDAYALIDVITTGHRRKLRQLVGAYRLAAVPDAAANIEAWAHGAAERSAARELDTSPEEVSAAAMALWSRSLSAELRSRRRKGLSTTNLVDDLRPTLRRISNPTE